MSHSQYEMAAMNAIIEIAHELRHIRMLLQNQFIVQEAELEKSNDKWMPPADD